MIGPWVGLGTMGRFSRRDRKETYNATKGKTILSKSISEKGTKSVGVGWRRGQGGDKLTF